jgi:hypothetical protein
LVLLAAIAAPAAAVPTPGPELWRQLAALPYLAAQAMEGRKEELVGTLAQGMAEAAEKQLMQHATDQVVVGVCSNQTKALAKRLERALEKAPWDEDAGAKPLQEAATNVLLAKATSIVSPPQGAALSASSHLQLAEAAPPFLGDANDARSTSTLLEHVWRQLPEMLLQSVDAQAPARMPLPPARARARDARPCTRPLELSRGGGTRTTPEAAPASARRPSTRCVS